MVQPRPISQHELNFLYPIQLTAVPDIFRPGPVRTEIQLQSGSVSTVNNDNNNRYFQYETDPTTMVSSGDNCKRFCGINSVCREVLGRPVCGCPESHTGDPSVEC